ncbi:MAG TPA: hypothetical protein VF807_05480 [Ktedonobacterales bacterium]
MATGLIRRFWRRGRVALTPAIGIIALLALGLQGCESVPGPVQIKLADPSPHSDNAKTFSSPGFQSTSGRVISVATSADGKRVYAGTLRGGLWRSDDAGVNWSQITTAQPGDNTRGCADADPTCSLPAATIADVVTSPSNPDIVVASIVFDGRKVSADGLYRSQDGGKMWARVYQAECNGATQPVTQVVMAADDASRLWAASACGVAYSPKTNGDAPGATWALGGMPDSTAIAHIAAASSGGASRRVYACNGNNLYVSLDAGKSFLKDASAATSLPASACAPTSWATHGLTSGPETLAVVPGHPDEVYVTSIANSNALSFFAVTSRDASSCDGSGTKCGGALWHGVYSSGDATSLASQWEQSPAPPFYDTGATSAQGSAVFVRLVATSGGYLILFSDGASLSVSAGKPTDNGWHRLDGPDASAASQTGAQGPDAAKPFQPVHVDPLAVTSTADFGLTLAPATAPDATYAHNAQLGACAGGKLFYTTAGGVYASADCGQTWQAAKNLENLTAVMLTGLPRPQSSHPYKLPAIYFGSLDNHDWYSTDGGLHWRGGDDTCSDCYGYWSDQVRGDLVVHPVSQEGLTVYTGLGGDAPDLYDSRSVAHVGYPETLSASNAAGALVAPAVTDWLDGARPLIATAPGEQGSPPVDLAVIAPDATPTATGSPPVAAPTLVVWRKQTLSEGTADWVADGVALPVGATLLQAAGGHKDTVYYVGDRAAADSTSTLDTTLQGNHLWRSHRDSAGKLDGWDCIVPGPATAGQHDGQCAQAVTGAAISRAYTFVADPYDAKIVYALDADGVKQTTDGGATWQRVQTLSDWVFEGGRRGADCITFCVPNAIRSRALSSLVFVPDEPQMRFALSDAGVFFTNNGVSETGKTESWHRLLDASALACTPTSGFFDKVNTAGRALYVACAGRSLIAFVGIPRPGQALDYSVDSGGQYPYPPIIITPGTTPTPPSHVTPLPTVAVTPTPSFTIDFRVVPTTSYTQSCAAGLKTMAFKLDNTRSQGDVTWTLSLKDADPGGNTWATASGVLGTIPKAQIGTLTLSPATTVCQTMQSAGVAQKTYTAVLSYTGGQQIVLSDTVSLS